MKYILTLAALVALASAAPVVCWFPFLPFLCPTLWLTVCIYSPKSRLDLKTQSNADSSTVSPLSATFCLVAHQVSGMAWLRDSLMASLSLAIFFRVVRLVNVIKWPKDSSMDFLSLATSSQVTRPVNFKLPGMLTENALCHSWQCSVMFDHRSPWVRIRAMCCDYADCQGVYP